MASLDAGKHVYQEKTMAFTVEHAKKMRAAWQRAGKRTVQIGHQGVSSGQIPDAASFLKPELMGKITAIHAHMYRNTPHGKPQWARPVYPDMTAENIVWKSFLGEAPARDFDANRYINWRYFWDYSGGNVYENMCHQLAFWYKALGLKIPKAVTMTGGIYLWKDGREVPDTMNVSMEHAEEILFSWDSGFGNDQLKVTEDVLGDNGTISRGQQIRYTPQKVNRPDGNEMMGATRSAAARPHAEFPRLHPLGPGAELPVRAGVPRFHRLPHGGGKLPATAHRALGCRQGRDRLRRRERNLKAEIGIIGGSGLYSMPGFETQEEAAIETPFGWPSDNYVVGTLAGRQVAFLARHGRGHRISPSELNFRANIYGMKSLGVERIISLSAVGSLKEEHRPLDFVIPDQFFDRTRGRVSTFFGEGLVAHISFADPVCPELSEVVAAAGRAAGVNIKKGGTYLCMEGPAFSTKAESNVYRSWGMDVIGMTNLQEAKLAREAEICYVTVAMVTDYDCWHPDHDAVTVNDIIANLMKNAENACQVVAEAVASMPAARGCQCGSALAHAIITDRKLVPAATRQKLGILIDKYFV